MENNTSQKVNKEENKIIKFLKDKKNIAIVILSFLLLCAFCAYTNPVDVTQYENEINNLKNQTVELNAKLEDNKKQITYLQDANKLLQEDKSKLEQEKQSLEKEKSELNIKVEELEKTSTTKATNPTTPTDSTSQISKSSTPTTSSSTSSTKSSTETSVTTSTTNSQTVWIGATGDRYHRQTCSTLKGKGTSITLQQAQSQGRQPCKTCKP